MKRISAGFTLIELMIVIAIIAILASIAISVYNNSIGKAQLSEAITVVDGMKVDVADYQHQTGACPNAGSGNIQAPASYSGKYVASVTVTPEANGCVITALMRSNTVAQKLRGKTVSFSMTPNSGNSAWTCSSNAPAVYLPQACR